MTREQTVGLLLITMNDYLPTVKGSTSLLAAVPGAGESLYTPCEDCAGTGRVVGNRPCEVCKAGKTAHPTGLLCVACRVCDGEGERKRRSKKAYDAYTGKLLADLHEETVNARIEPRKKFVMPTQPDFAEEEGWIRERERYWRHGSYAELYSALNWLRDRHLLRYETLMHWVSSQGDRFWHWSDESLDTIQETIRMVTHRMPPGIKAPGWVVRAYKEETRGATSDGVDRVSNTGPENTPALDSRRVHRAQKREG